MTDLPDVALSVRQLWAHAIIYFAKDIENRSWQAVNHGLRRRGRVAIHAAKGMTKDEYWEAREFIDGLGWTCPDASKLRRGGIIGSVEVVDVVRQSDSPWFFGPRGLVLRDPKPSPFIPAVGALGYFKWVEADASIIPAPAAWMLPKPPKLTETVKRMMPDPDLFGNAEPGDAP
jgi:hypothetical protein